MFKNRADLSDGSSTKVTVTRTSRWRRSTRKKICGKSLQSFQQAAADGNLAALGGHFFDAVTPGQLKDAWLQRQVASGNAFIC
jgi:hypothetical protein